VVLQGDGYDIGQFSPPSRRARMRAAAASIQICTGAPQDQLQLRTQFDGLDGDPSSSRASFWQGFWSLDQKKSGRVVKSAGIDRQWWVFERDGVRTT